MSIKNDLPYRKATRLKGYDYSLPGTYFVTVCTKERKEILCSIITDAVVTPYGCASNYWGVKKINK